MALTQTLLQRQLALNNPVVAGEQTMAKKDKMECECFEVLYVGVTEHGSRGRSQESVVVFALLLGVVVTVAGEQNIAKMGTVEYEFFEVF